MKLLASNFFVLALTAFSQFAAAQTTILGPGESVTVGSRQIICTTGGGGGGGGGTSSACVSQLSSWCYSNTSRSRDTCYNSAASYCPSTSFASCVSSTASYCYSNTSMSRDECYDSALGTCRGSPEMTNELLEQVRIGAELKAQGLDLKETKTDLFLEK